jgi:hypothetical protein
MATSRRQVLTYLFFVFLFSSLFYFLIIRAKQLSAGGGIYVSGIMWCPALAAFATLTLNGRSLSDLGWKWPAKKFALMSWYVPLLYATIAYLIVWLSGLGGFPNHEFVAAITTRMGPRLLPRSRLLFMYSWWAVLALSAVLPERSEKKSAGGAFWFLNCTRP